MRTIHFVVEFIRSRLPVRHDLAVVFSTLLFVVFGWSIRGFLYKIPAFSLYFGLTTDLAVLCYMMAFALFESLVVVTVLAAMAVALPSRFLKEGFAYKGFLIVVVSTVAMIVFEGYYKVNYFKDIMAGDRSSIPPFIAGLVVSMLLLLGLLRLFRMQPRLQRYAVYAAEQISLFAYIYIPLGLLGLLVVIVRNLR